MSFHQVHMAWLFGGKEYVWRSCLKVIQGVSVGRHTECHAGEWDDVASAISLDLQRRRHSIAAAWLSRRTVCTDRDTHENAIRITGESAELAPPTL